MQSELFEKRKYRRLLLSAAKPVNAWILKNANPNVVVQVTVLNLSEGGLGLASVKNASCTLYKNEWVKLIYVEGGIDLSFLIGMNMQIRWLFQDPLLDHVCFGCEFKDPPSSSAERIRTIIAEAEQP